MSRAQRRHADQLTEQRDAAHSNPKWRLFPVHVLQKEKVNKIVLENYYLNIPDSLGFYKKWRNPDYSKVFSTFVNGELRIAEKAVPVSQAGKVSVQIHIALQEIFIQNIVPLKSVIFSLVFHK